eukprot:TRINITY_DN70631_c0_g1_i1.p1 TRINITY_DN70631_c0_g1~~TRINITY_DN70631_c0_g1_i1.p1  ORF type:complete len:429 (-),score=123.78 TRINITY_DN70631_c0_g1_i1:50-1336(-)
MAVDELTEWLTKSSATAEAPSASSTASTIADLREPVLVPKQVSTNGVGRQRQEADDKSLEKLVEKLTSRMDVLDAQQRRLHMSMSQMGGLCGVLSDELQRHMRQVDALDASFRALQEAVQEEVSTRRDRRVSVESQMSFSAADAAPEQRAIALIAQCVPELGARLGELELHVAHHAGRLEDLSQVTSSGGGGSESPVAAGTDDSLRHAKLSAHERQIRFLRSLAEGWTSDKDVTAQMKTAAEDSPVDTAIVKDMSPHEVYSKLELHKERVENLQSMAHEWLREKPAEGPTAILAAVGGSPTLTGGEGMLLRKGLELNAQVQDCMSRMNKCMGRFDDVAAELEGRIKETPKSRAAVPYSPKDADGARLDEVESTMQNLGAQVDILLKTCATAGRMAEVEQKISALFAQVDIILNTVSLINVDVDDAARA